MVFDDVKIPTLYGISAIGTRLSLYTVSKETGYIEPEAIPDERVRGKDIAPADRWNLDILTPEGEERLREVVANVKTMCEELGRLV